jgi:DDE family transposase
MHGSSYCSTAAQCRECPQKQGCTATAYRKLFIRWYEPAREVARALVGTPSYERSRRARYKVEALFAELKQRLLLRRVRLRRLWNVAEQFHLAATAQNLKRLVHFLVQRQLQPELSSV